MKSNFGILSAYSIPNIIHTLLCLGLAAFFIYAGTKKFIPKKPRPANTEAIIQAVEADDFPRPISFRLCVKMMKTSGFLDMVGILQILSGILIVFHRTRLIGLLLLLPIIVNIFTLHVFMDNRMGENIETGLLLLANIALLVPYYKTLRNSLFNPDFV